MTYNSNIETMSCMGVLNYYSVTEGRGRWLLAYSCSSPYQVHLQRPVIDKKKARGTSWAVINETLSCLFISEEGRAGPHIHTCFLAPSSVPGESP
ncbi:innexin [Plakobranchus ocellatus]|uniref:Innexin n=1 Tax=Plakobranchus ocellatus TaxID=259542 RepID=A0AAV3YNN8_9GAST|nr:innexin [Plakobranchus ocellatus]